MHARNWDRLQLAHLWGPLSPNCLQLSPPLHLHKPKTLKPFTWVCREKKEAFCCLLLSLAISLTFLAVLLLSVFVSGQGSPGLSLLSPFMFYLLWGLTAYCLISAARVSPLHAAPDGERRRHAAAAAARRGLRLYLRPKRYAAPH